jgi:hypothetical protein
MQNHHYNYLWIILLVAGVIGTFFLIKTAYANPLNLPNYAFTKPDIKEAYSFAKTNYSNLIGLPCNCGCMTPEGAAVHGSRVHENGLADCFMDGNVNENGKWDSHASECGLCYEDALFAKGLYEEGKSKLEIKSALEEKYAAQTTSNITVYGGVVNEN